jgi:hypothetical protein
MKITASIVSNLAVVCRHVKRINWHLITPSQRHDSEEGPYIQHQKAYRLEYHCAFYDSISKEFQFYGVTSGKEIMLNFSLGSLAAECCCSFSEFESAHILAENCRIVETKNQLMII